MDWRTAFLENYVSNWLYSQSLTQLSQISISCCKVAWKLQTAHQTLQVVPERSRIASMQFKVGSLVRNSHTPRH